MKREYLVLIVGLPLMLLVIELQYWLHTGQFIWSYLAIMIEIGLIIFLWCKYPLLKKLVGETGLTKRPRWRLVLNWCLVILLFIPFSLYLLTGELNQQIPLLAQFSIIAVAPVLGGLVLAAASNLEKISEKRLSLMCVAQKFISATVLFIFFVPFIYTVNLLSIDPNSFKWFDPVAWYRGIYFWLAVPCFYVGIVLFLFGIMDLVFVLVELDTKADIRQAPKKRTSQIRSSKRQ